MNICKLVHKLLGINKILDRLFSLENKYNELEKIYSIINVGIDVHYKCGSWAVVCIKGKSDYINFIDLNNKDIHEITSFIRMFEKSSKCIDTPGNVPRDFFLR